MLRWHPGNMRLQTSLGKSKGPWTVVCVALPILALCGESTLRYVLESAVSTDRVRAGNDRVSNARALRAE